MWITKWAFSELLKDREISHERLEQTLIEVAQSRTSVNEHKIQKAKDDLSLDWLRHRVNALEKQNAILLQKAAGVIMPVPEIVASRPGTMSTDFSHMPSFEDVGDAEAERLGIKLDPAGFIAFKDAQRVDPQSEG